jgi:hypothetical protein
MINNKISLIILVFNQFYMFHYDIILGMMN